MFEKTNVQFQGDTVIKSGDPAFIRIEVEKTRRAGSIGRESGLFRVPQVIHHDESRGVAVFERIRGIEPLYSATSWGRLCISLVERIGKSLAVVHRNLELPPDMVIPLPPEFAAIGQDVFLHGDPSVRNICIERDSSSIVIIDWQMTPVHGGQATYGCRYFDILWFINNLLWVPRLRHLFSDPVSPVARKFLESYYLEANIPYDAEAISGYAERFFSTKLPLRSLHSRRERFFFRRCNALTQRFIRSLRADVFHDEL